jgi:DNA-binding transcriptional MerR regulator
VKGGATTVFAFQKKQQAPRLSDPHTTRRDTLTIGQVARLTGVGAKAIRYYEEAGLLPSPPRGENRYRRYGLIDVNRLILLRRLRLLGVPLSATKPLLMGTDAARCAEVQQQVLALVEKRLAAIDQEIAELRLLRSQVERYQRALAGCHPGAGDLFRECVDMACLDVQGQASDQEARDDCCQL